MKKVPSTNERLPAKSYNEMKNLYLLSILNSKRILENKEIHNFFNCHEGADLSNDFDWYSSFPISDRKCKRLAAVLDSEIERSLALRKLEDAMRKGIQAIPICDPCYPELLKEINSPPSIIWVYGNAIERCLAMPKFTIVGTRNATPYGERACRDIARYISLREACVVSGMALGIDGYAHSAALNADGFTIAVLASGVDFIYPKQHVALYRRILEQGMLLSEYPPGTNAASFRFPVRNRILAGLSQVVIVVESSMRSGSLITVNHALDNGRDVLAVPGNIFSPESKGPNHLISEGCRPLISYKDLDEFLSTRNTSGQRAGHLPINGAVQKQAKGDNENQDEIIRMLSSQNLSVDELCRAGNWHMDTLIVELTSMEAKSLISNYRGRYTLTSNGESSI